MMKKILLLIATVILFLASLYIYSKLTESTIKIEETYIKSNTIPTSFNGARIVQFSDTLIETEKDLELLSKVVEKINRAQPDIVIFTGDLFTSSANTTIIQETKNLLAQIEATISKIAVLGDTDLTYHEETVSQTLIDANFQILRNESLSLYNGTSETLNFVGVDSLTTSPQIGDMIDLLNKKTFNILLLHEPNLAPTLTEEAVNLQLSGSCLGVNTTASSTTLTPNYCEQFYAGTYRFADKLILHVNEGIKPVPLTKSLTKRPTIHSFLLLKQ